MDCTIPGVAAPAISAHTTGRDAHCGEVELAMMPAPCIQWTSTWSTTTPTLPSCNDQSETGPNAVSDQDPAWLAMGSGTLPTLDFESLNTLCGEVELCAMPDMNHLWPSGGRGSTSTLSGDWNTLCKEVEISTMQSIDVPWMASGAVQGF
jgi:hypothetical protein